MNSHFLGRAGEYAVASQLLSRGIPVHFPAVDTGSDLIAGEKIRIQVKSTRIFQGTARSAPRKGYCFSLNTAVPNWANGRHKTKLRDWSKVCDFIVFWGMDENRFWVVPSTVVSGGPKKVQTIVLGAPQTHWTVNRDEVKALLSTGLSQREVAKRIGVSEMSVSRVAHGQHDSVPSPNTKCNKYENAWHEIISAVGLVNQIDEAVIPENEGAHA